MKTATVGEIQKNFAQVLKSIQSGEEVMITKRGKAVAKIVSIGPKESIDWPDFAAESLVLKGKPASEIITESRNERL